MVSQISPEQMAIYRAAARRRMRGERQELARRRERAWKLAREAAALLKKEFGASRVVVFGSLLRSDCFTRWSDVDIAAWGIRPEDTFKAIGAVLDLDSTIEINLVDMGACRPSLRAVIERKGVDV
ncbi:MAG: nucleotidyltransferase domain-containing protein [Clostridia bacterium]|nr:nucleotidyltransferase domain-containing protein [Clostridia bacterium]